MLTNVRYQVGIVDAAGGSSAAALQSLVEGHAKELGLDPSRDLQFFHDLAVVGMSNAGPKVAVYFGGLNYNRLFDAVIRDLVASGDTVLPVVPMLRDFSKQVPTDLWPINGIEMSNPNDLERVAALVMESLHLLRRRRKIFISYKRVESQTRRNAALS